MPDRPGPLLIVSSKAPYGTGFAQEALDAVLAVSVFTPVRLLFMRDGVFQLTPGQEGGAAGRKTFTRGFAALPHYGVQDLFVCEESLARRGLSLDELAVAVQPAKSRDIQQLLASHQQVLSF